MNIVQIIIIESITLYQRTLSPDHGWLRAWYPHGFCHFYPSCSEYTKQAVQKHGAARGSIMGLRRIARCNPWTQPSIDTI